MSISSRFAVGIHILTLIGMNKDGVSTSEFLAGSVNTNPVVIRKIMGMMKKAGLVKLRPGVAGAQSLPRSCRKLRCSMCIKRWKLFMKKDCSACMEIRIRNVLLGEIFSKRSVLCLTSHSLRWNRPSEM